MDNFAGLSSRIKALFGDLFFLGIMMFVIVAVFDKIGEVSDDTRKIAFFTLFGVYEPVMVGVFGATIGQFMFKLRVRKESDHSKKINILAAFFRFAVKAVLGIISLFTISASEKSKAIHDYASMSVVLDLNELPVYSETDSDDVVSDEDLL